MRVTKYFANWQISIKGKIHTPAAPGETPVAITDLPEDEIGRLLEMGAIRKMVFDDGRDGNAIPRLEEEQPDTGSVKEAAGQIDGEKDAAAAPTATESKSTKSTPKGNASAKSQATQGKAEEVKKET